MNERIKELVIQANDETQLMMIMEYRSFESKLYERFAELIIKECAKFVSSASVAQTYAERDACVRAGKDLKTYFGVDQ